MPEFEVASVKPTDVNGEIKVGVWVYPGGRTVISGCELTGLIRIAYQLSYQEISGGADWTDRVKYDVEAVPPAAMRAAIRDLRHGTWSIADEHLRQMLQALLETRFQLQFHRETKTGRVYLLKQAAKQPALHPTTVDLSSPRAPYGLIHFRHWRDCGSGRCPAGEWVLEAATMADVARYASMNALSGTPVLDRTRLSGAFDYKQSRADVDSEDRDADFASALASSFLSFLQELHLKLERAKGPVETFVIDRARKPLPN
jgi:uncharacterized protein (TIGR03435 family)